MSKLMSESELEKHIDAAISELETYLYDLNTSLNDHLRKRSMLISYWIKDYVRYCKDEDTYQPPNRKYKRGDVLLVDFGYRVGSELGGRHFAVVVDCHNFKRSNLITVVPLSSKKEGYKEGLYSFELKCGIEKLYQQKRADLLTNAQDMLIDIKQLRQEMYDEDDITKKNKKLSELEISVDKVFKQILVIDSLDKDMKKLKSGTTVSVGQIITISKQRIINPKSNKDSLSKINLKGQDMDKLNDKLKNLYFH